MQQRVTFLVVPNVAMRASTPLASSNGESLAVRPKLPCIMADHSAKFASVDLREHWRGLVLE